ncbi:hypothetical protein CASFOL_031240 [Castilleja foliolosa]|uniref:TF-B3 domain-containing protein n=1 Tax=Castilleja foliolosa TaxID=1961234 RepID=A0ABD3C732_9LAMI
MVVNMTEDDEIYYLTEVVPFFDIVLSKSHVNYPWQLSLPVTWASSMLPREAGPATLKHGGKNWTMQYIPTRTRFISKWKNFVIDNELKIGDACVFELIDPSPENLTFKVHILRDEWPPELKALDDTCGETSKSPIVID